MPTWIKSESGILINSDAVKEFAIIGPYKLGDDEPEEERRYYDLYALGVGDVEVSYGPTRKPFADAHRYLVQHTDHEERNEVLRCLKQTLRTGGRYLACWEVVERFRRSKSIKACRRQLAAAGGPS
jgi:hypothetical protein